MPSSMEVIATFDEGANVNVSEADGDEFEKQKNDAIDFLQAQSEALKALTAQKGFHSASLDFGVYAEEMWSKSYTFSPQLSALAAQHQLELMVSVYATENT